MQRITQLHIKHTLCKVQTIENILNIDLILLFLQDLYGKDIGATEKHLPSRIEKAAKHHSMPSSPSAQKAKNVRTVVQVNSLLHIYSSIIYCSDTI